MAAPVANCVEVSLYWGITGAGAINRLHALTTGSVTVNQALADTLGSAIKGLFTSTGYAAHIAPGVSLIRIGVRDMRIGNGNEFRDAGATVPGTGTGDVMPAYTALCVTLRTAFSGKSYRGRVYLGGFTETDNTAGQATAALGTSAVAFLQGVSGALSSNGMALAVLSRAEEGHTVTKVIAPRGGALTAVSTIQLRDQRWDSQRRRNNPYYNAPTVFAPPVAEAHVGAGSG